MPSSCSFITGARSSTYTLVPADAGTWVIAAVSAANSVATGTKWTASAVASVAELPPPSNTTAPTLAGNARIGDRVTVGIGVWTESPSSYSYQWFACEEALTASSELSDSCSELEFETSWVYEPTDADAGMYLLAEVTARNSTGSATTYSATSAIVPGLPVVISEPEIFGTSLVGVGLQAEAGYWDYWDYSDDSTDEMEFQWLRCDQPSEFSLDIPETCEPIMFENNYGYWITPEDEGHYIVLAVTATNGIGSSVAFSTSTLMVEYGIVVSGFLTAGDDGEPVVFENIRFENLENWMLSGSAFTDEYGYFEVSLYAGEYFISLESQDDTFVTGPLPGGSWDSAEVYTITEQTELDLTVQRSGSVSGCLYADTLDESIAWRNGETGGLSLWKQSYGDNWFEVASHDFEDFAYFLQSADRPDGCLEYIFRGVAPGEYKLFIGSPGEQDPLHERMWFGDATTPEMGEWIFVGPSEVTDVSDIELTLNTGSTPAKAPVLTRTVTSPDEVKYSWTKPQSAAPILGYYLETGCGYWGDSLYVMGEDSLEINWGDWAPDRPTVCNFSVRAITTTGHGYTSVVTWSHGTTQQGPELTISDISATGFNVIAQSGAADSESYWFVLSGEGVDSDQASVVGQLYDEAGLYTPGDPYAVEYADLVPGRTYTLKVANTYPDYNFTNWTTTTITLRNAPSNTVAPVITGTARVANPLSVSAGTWTESPTAITYQWLRCREASAVSLTKPATCEITLNQPQSTYTSTKADAGYFLVAAVSAENEYGLSTVYTASTQAIAGLPVNTVAPALTGTARYKQTLTASRGTWIESPIAYTYQWYKCRESSAVASAKPQTCEIVTGARSSKYAMKVSDLGYFFVAAVTARNSIGSATRWSASSLAVAGLPVNTVAPTVSGEARIGSEMTLSIGTWTESPTSYAYQWFQCDEATTVSSIEPDVCYAIDGATSWRYEVDVADAWMFLVAEVTARNALGSAVKYSASSEEIDGSVLNAPTISGTPVVGATLSIEAWWSEVPAPSVSAEWFACDTPIEGYGVQIPSDCVALPNQLGVSAIAAGFAHTCAIVGFDHEVYCWGSNSNGQLGDGGVMQNSKPIKVAGISSAVSIDVPVESFAEHSCAVLSDGTVHCWGWNGDGQLGDGTTSQSLTPVRVQGISAATSVAVGNNHGCAIEGEGAVRCWGSNSSGELGDGTTARRNSAVEVSGISDAVQIAAGAGHTCAILENQTVTCWGSNWGFQLGLTNSNNQPTPQVVPGLTDIVAVSAGWAHTCALDSDGLIWCWGIGYAASPVHVETSSNANSISSGIYHSCAALSTGSVQCWGGNDDGQLGNGSTVSSDRAVSVLGISDAISVSAGGYHTCAINSSGATVCWGLNSTGQLGDGTTLNQPTPSSVQLASQQLRLNSDLVGKHILARVTAVSPCCIGGSIYILPSTSAVAPSLTNKFLRGLTIPARLP
jgi:alpha-tubulin suppressor-like RCC1 family protein